MWLIEYKALYLPKVKGLEKNPTKICEIMKFSNRKSHFNDKRLPFLDFILYYKVIISNQTVLLELR